MNPYKPYPVYKDSGVEWLGKVPEDWEIKLLGQIGKFQKGNGATKADEAPAGVPCIRYGDLYTTHNFFIHHSRSFVACERLPEYTIIQYGDVLFAASGETHEEIGKSAVNLIQSEACCGGDIIIFRATLEVDPAFIGYAADCRLSVAQKSLMGRGFTVIHIYADQLKKLYIVFPPLSEQIQISAFLNQETARINALVSKKSRFIELLREKRQALLTQAVTRGLDPTAKMKDSGVEWLGEVPEHWEVRTLKYITNFCGGGTPSRDNLGFWNGDIPWVSPKDMKVEAICETEENITQAGLLNSAARLVPANQILLVVRSGILKHTIPIAINVIQVALNQDMRALFFNHNLCIGKFFLRWVQGFNNDLLQAWRKQGATVESIEQDYLSDTIIPLPSIAEQQAIVAYLDREATRIDSLISKTQHSINLLKERRAALITAAVTGQIDVRYNSPTNTPP